MKTILASNSITLIYSCYSWRKVEETCMMGIWKCTAQSQWPIKDLQNAALGCCFWAESHSVSTNPFSLIFVKQRLCAGLKWGLWQLLVSFSLVCLACKFANRLSVVCTGWLDCYCSEVDQCWRRSSGLAISGWHLFN